MPVVVKRGRLKMSSYRHSAVGLSIQGLTSQLLLLTTPLLEEKSYLGAWRSRYVQGIGNIS
jgi:hypothetical protein